MEERPPTVLVTRVEPAEWARFRDVRLAVLSDSPRMFGSAVSKELQFAESEWRRRAERPATFLATHDGTDVGLAAVHEFEGHWTVVSMWISPTHRGTGVVDSLMGACEDAALQAGADHVLLAVMEDNLAGRRAYRRLGFTETGRVDVVADGRRELWMVKLLR